VLIDSSFMVLCFVCWY